MPRRSSATRWPRSRWKRTLEAENEDEDDDGAAPCRPRLLQLKADALERFATIRDLYVKMMKALQQARAPQDKTYLRAQKQISDELMNIRFSARTIERLCDSRARHGRGGAQPRAQDQDLCVEQGAHAAPALHQGLPRQRDQPRLARAARSHASKPYSGAAHALRAGHPRRAAEADRPAEAASAFRSRISRTSTSRCPPAKPRRAAPSAK